MNTTKHTAEPWEVCGQSICPVTTHGSSCKGGIRLATVYGIHSEAHANAARIVACVNACAEDGPLHALLTRLAGRQADAGATAQERVDAADAATILRALGG